MLQIYIFVIQQAIFSIVENKMIPIKIIQYGFDMNTEIFSGSYRSLFYKSYTRYIDFRSRHFCLLTFKFFP